MDDEWLKRTVDSNYFDELLARIRVIRSAEKVFWCMMLDIYATSKEKELTTFRVKGVFSSKIKEIGV